MIQDDKMHDKAIDELMSRRKTQLRAWHDYVDANKTIESELAKFKWLQEQEVLTKEEADLRVAQVHAEYGVVATPRTLN